MLLDVVKRQVRQHGKGNHFCSFIKFKCDGCNAIHEMKYDTLHYRSHNHFCDDMCRKMHYIVQLKCDQCGIQIQKKRSIVTKHNFCSDRCMNDAGRVGNVLYNQKIRTSQEKYACDHAAQNGLAKNKRKATNVTRYGVSNPFESEDVKLKIIKTNILNRGVSYPTQDPVVINKQQQTNVERYGVRNVFQSSMIKAQIKNTIKTKYGVEYAGQLQSVIKASHAASAIKKCHKTMKQKGLYDRRMTRPEKILNDLLCQRFLIEGVRYQYFIHRWPIDFYISCIKTFIQVDGVYWHGLDRPIEEITRFRTPRDKNILKKIQTDVQQNEWFMNNGMNLIRVTDKELLSNDLSKLKDVLNGTDSYQR